MVVTIDKLKNYFSNSYTFAQCKMLRKWHGGKWTKVSVHLRDKKSTIDIWVKGEPKITYEQILKVENWG